VGVGTTFTSHPPTPSHPTEAYTWGCGWVGILFISDTLTLTPSIVSMVKHLYSNCYRCWENENLLKSIALQNAPKVTYSLIVVSTISPDWLIRLSWNFGYLPKYVSPTYCKNISQISEIDWTRSHRLYAKFNYYALKWENASVLFFCFIIHFVTAMYSKKIVNGIVLNVKNV